MGNPDLAYSAYLRGKCDGTCVIRILEAFSSISGPFGGLPSRRQYSTAALNAPEYRVHPPLWSNGLYEVEVQRSPDSLREANKVERFHMHKWQLLRALSMRALVHHVHNSTLNTCVTQRDRSFRPLRTPDGPQGPLSARAECRTGWFVLRQLGFSRPVAELVSW